MKFFREFKDFAMRGNVIDLAVGVILGTAFNKIVSSLVSDIIMPPLGILIGGIDFKDFSLVLKAATETEAAVTLSYGLFLQNIFDFIIVAFSIFIAIRLINSFHKKQEAKEEEAPATPSNEEQLLTEIRDLLKEGSHK